MPTRNLSIMFTDIKGFTERTSGSTRQGMKALLDAHDRLLKPVFRHFAGTIVKTIGDAFLVHFESPTDAVLCGVTIQEVLRQYNSDIDDHDRLEVRVAINVGEVDLRENDILGEAVNIAARLEGITEAGEVWFTDAVYQTMNRSEAPSAEVGERLFKGIPHPIRVYRVINEPGSELAQSLAATVKLSDNGPVLHSEQAPFSEQTSGTPSSKRTHLLIYAGAAIVLLFSVTMLLPSANERLLSQVDELVAVGDVRVALQLLDEALIDDPANRTISQRATEVATTHLDNLSASGRYEEALSWLRAKREKHSYLESLRDREGILDAHVTVTQVIKERSQYHLHYIPPPLAELLDRHPQSAQVPYQAARLIQDHWHAITPLLLFSDAHKRGLQADELIFESAVKALSEGEVYYPKFEIAQKLLVEHYQPKATEWALESINGHHIMAYMNGWKLLKGIEHKVVANDYYATLFALININDEEKLNALLEKLKAQESAQRRDQIIGYLGELTDTFPMFLNYTKLNDRMKGELEDMKREWQVIAQ
ncbi:MAG: adenylate/guanylate cyclase domain-containing protein [Chromatiales bacterium]|nr:adenylate/guanylate cyclase domain-containing protein [Chromatiales bacterium]